MLPCFLGGFLSRLVSSAASAVINLPRVSRGAITWSMNPCSAAMYGLANFSRYSAILAARAAATFALRAAASKAPSPADSISRL
jgi:hypothetical protein